MILRESFCSEQIMDEESIKNSIQYTKKFQYVPIDTVLCQSMNPILKDFLITSAGYYKYALGHHVYNRILHYEYSMIYVIDGCGCFKTEGYTWNINAGDIFFLFKNVEHSYETNNNNPWSTYWINFSGESALYYLNTLNVTPRNPVLQIGNRANIIMEINEIFNTFNDGYGYIQLLYASSCARHILTYIIKDQTDFNEDILKGISFKKAINYMQSNIGKKFSLDELSSYSNLSKYYFIHKFKEATGITPLDYFLRLKIQKASELLVSSTMKINEISELLGYDNYYYFSSVFKKITGYSPQQYRIKQK
jgi:AraC family transcriptional regulator of arabinose operon